MLPADFVAVIAQPNMQEALEHPDDLRAIVNAILTLDALAGMLHAYGKRSGRPEMAQHASDDGYRESLAKVSPSFRLLRDAAAALKHGELTHPRKHSLPRLVSRSDSMRDEVNTLGMFEIGDELGASVIVIEFDPGPGYQRASTVIADTYRMLRRITDGEPARTDEHG